LGAALACVLLAWGAGAEEETPPPDAGPEQDAALSFDLGWDHGPTYELQGRVPVSRLGAPTWLDEVHVEGRVGGSLYLDGGLTSRVPAQDDGWEAEVRKARISTKGVFEYALPIEYKVEFSVENRRFLVDNFYLGWRPPRFAERVRVGWFDVPATLQNTTSSSSRVLMEVGSPVAAFAPASRPGVDARGRWADSSLSWYLSLSTLGQQQEVGNASEENARLFSRLVWRPLGPPATGEPLLHLGLSTSYAPNAGDTTIRYRSRPESFLTDYVVDTDDIEGSAGVVGLEAAWQDGPRILQAELLFSNVQSDEGEDPFFYGVYVQASWSLTGEVRDYDLAESVIGRLVPREPFAPRRGHWGALEMGVRLSWLDLSDGAVRGGEMLSLTVGPAWTLNRWVRVMANYGMARVRNAPDEGTLHVLQARLELVF
jgi:phosphate-selective porin OprO/OprP